MKFRICLVLVSFSLAFFQLPGKIEAKQSLHFLHQDHLGSISLVTSDQGMIVSQQAYFPYGSARESVGNIPSERHYTGQVSDVPQTGLYYYNARYYDPLRALFNQSDNQEGPNRYLYVASNPLIYTDPSGHQADPFAGAKASGNVSSGGLYLPVILRGFYQGLEEVSRFSPRMGRLMEEDLGPELRDKIKVIESQTIGHMVPGGFVDSKGLSRDGVVLFPREDQFEDAIRQSAADWLVSFYGEGDFYAMSAVHEFRHLWQRQSKENLLMARNTAQMAFDRGLLHGIEDFSQLGGIFGYSLIDPSETRLPIRPHRMRQLAEIFPWFGELFSDSSLELLPWRFITYSSFTEVDAILTETAFIDPSFKYRYPQIYNYILGSGFFNYEKYQMFYSTRDDEY